MKIISLLLLILVSTANAQTQNKKYMKVRSNNARTNVPQATTAAPTKTTYTTPVASTTAAAAPAPKPQPWRLVYFGDYVGPRLSNFDLTKTQAPTLGSQPEYTAWSHSLKIGYAVASDLVLGTQIRMGSNFDPSAANPFVWKNHRFYLNWRSMIDTADIDMTGGVDWELPTSTGAKNNGLVAAFNIKLNWTIKTSLRNWSFSAMTFFRPMFYNNPNKNGDLYLALYPFISYDFSDSWAFVFEGSFDASHSYNDTYFNFGEDDPDNMNVGVQYSFNSHFQINPALKFFTANYSVPVIYLGVTGAL